MQNIGNLLRFAGITFIFCHLLAHPASAAINISINNGHQINHPHTHQFCCAHHKKRKISYRCCIKRKVYRRAFLLHTKQSAKFKIPCRYNQHSSQHNCRALNQRLYGRLGQPLNFTRAICYDDCGKAYVISGRRYLFH